MSELAPLNLPDFDLALLDLTVTPADVQPVTGGGPQPGPSAPGAGAAAGDGAEAAGEPFITPADVRATVSLPVSEYDEVKCNKCCNSMFVRRKLG
jgi:hypothetical protein